MSAPEHFHVSLDQLNRFGRIDRIVLVFVILDQSGKDIKSIRRGSAEFGKVVERLFDLAKCPDKIFIVPDGSDVVRYTVSGLISSYSLWVPMNSIRTRLYG